MTLRDYFAAAALNGLMGNPDVDHSAYWEEHATYAYKHADAMLSEREKKRTTNRGTGD